MNPSCCSPAEALDLASRITAVALSAQNLAADFGIPATLDLTGDLHVSAPVLPKTRTVPTVAPTIAPPETDALIAAIMAAEKAPEAQPAAEASGLRALAKAAPVQTAYVEPPAGTSGGAWTTDEDDRIAAAMIERHADPMSAIARDLAKVLDRTTGAIMFRGRNALKARIAAGIKARKELREDVIGAAEAAKIMAKHDEGLSFAEIGTALNRHPAAVASVVKRMVATRAAAPKEEVAPDTTFPEKADIPPAPSAEMGIPASEPATVEPKLDTPKSRFAVTPAMPGWQRDLREHINRLGYPAPWSPELDLMLVEELHIGRKLPEIAVGLGMDTSAVKARWTRLSALARDDRDRVTLDGQAHLLAEVKARAGQDQGTAAA